MEENNHKVSVYIATCNRLNKLKRAIESVKNQDYKNIEILICDDASTDGTRLFSENLALQDTRVKYFRNEENKGACATRNLGIFNATGKFITGLDDDDVFVKDRISFFVRNWSDNYSFTCTNFENKFFDKSIINYRGRKKIKLNYSNLLFSNEASNQVFTLTKRLCSIGGFDESVKRLQDWDTWLRLSYAYGPFVRYPESKYIMYHDHEQNEKRVSKSYPFVMALQDMAKRNENIYGEKGLLIINYIFLSVERKLKLPQLIKWIMLEKKPIKVMKYVHNYFKINRI
ncbi:glycosyltransferase [Brenneria goodwinii]|uniref:glycosyltransferase family 2 protein n=1 Tax=Brenneria goodwinii TaxID=1109412 RepID=UPI000EF27F6D|nr:glycosyltransferase [Brenneria goodwinii]MCG8158725.1 glycosyltransferase [Brenneria goodwinii]MCG8163260.1 glycosyltransferase [Brenneria goodwinii]MCG8167681.1 glycosyltransferase [Brenneria goodwinii]MCG8170587.1 glycosyltransferase [Brenneria goodwinii]MCG8174413.1 glycosyltransferase [Brenneria goodwinii]